MSLSTFSYSTGPATMQDVGELSYNGCKFSPLYETTVSGTCVQDSSNRTVKHVELTITADGYVTLPTGAADINATMVTLSTLLQAQAGVLIYKGRGYDVTVNSSHSSDRDVAWGPVPKLLEFQPLGGGLSAKVKWSVVTRIPVTKATGVFLQFNYDTSVSYGEDGYSSLTLRGIMEVPLTRRSQGDRSVTATADEFRQSLEAKVLTGIDLSRFRVTKRSFNLSQDKRTLEWDFAAEEKPYMDNPAACMVVRGTYSVKPLSIGLSRWDCTLRVTYTVRADRSRHNAWYAFINMLRLRMQTAGNGPAFPGAPAPPAGTRRTMLRNLTLDEGLHQDSKTVTFSATWRLFVALRFILTTSGLWRKLPERAGPTGTGRNLWATSVQDISGTRSWLRNHVYPSLDAIIDIGE